MAPIRELKDVWTDGPPLRLTLLARISGQSIDTLQRERAGGYLTTYKSHRRTSPHLVSRDEARRWLRTMGLAPSSESSRSERGPMSVPMRTPN